MYSFVHFRTSSQPRAARYGFERSLSFIGLSLLLAFPAYAEIYKYVDENGRVTYSNLPMKGSKKVDLPELNTVPGRKAGSAQSQTPSDFPRVEGKTQRERDDVRRKILEDELHTEEQALAEAQQALQEGESTRLGTERNYQRYLDRVQTLKSNVDLHEKNVSAIRKELSALK